MSSTEELRKASSVLLEKLQTLKKVKETYDGTAKLIKRQALDVERLIRKQFDALHQFLREEEVARIAALREEEEQKSRRMKENLERMTSEISSLSNTIRTIEVEIKAENVSFLQNVKSIMRAQHPLKELEEDSGALIDMANHLGNLKYKVWEKMQGIVQYTSVILDPNTANDILSVSDDLTGVMFDTDGQPLPDNPERFCDFRAVLGSRGYTKGRHCWEVDVQENTNYILGVASESVPRRERVVPSVENGFWIMIQFDGTYVTSTDRRVRVTRKPQAIRVSLDWDAGEVNFYDTRDGTHICSVKQKFTETVFPIFCTGCQSHPLRILPEKVCVQVGKG